MRDFMRISSALLTALVCCLLSAAPQQAQVRGQARSESGLKRVARQPKPIQIDGGITASNYQVTQTTGVITPGSIRLPVSRAANLFQGTIAWRPWRCLFPSPSTIRISIR